jgi:hypothetical protein
VKRQIFGGDWCGSNWAAKPGCEAPDIRRRLMRIELGGEAGM